MFVLPDLLNGVLPSSEGSASFLSPHRHHPGLRLPPDHPAGTCRRKKLSFSISPIISSRFLSSRRLENCKADGASFRGWGARHQTAPSLNSVRRKLRGWFLLDGAGRRGGTKHTWEAGSRASSGESCQSPWKSQKLVVLGCSGRGNQHDGERRFRNQEPQTRP